MNSFFLVNSAGSKNNEFINKNDKNPFLKYSSLKRSTIALIEFGSVVE